MLSGKFLFIINSTLLFLSLDFLLPNYDNLVIDYGQTNYESVIYPAEFPFYQEDLQIGNITISSYQSYQGKFLGNFFRIKENVYLKTIDTVITKIDYIQGGDPYKDLVLSYHGPIYSNDVISVVSQNRPSNSQNHSIQYFNSNNGRNIGVGLMYHKILVEEDFFSSFNYEHSSNRISYNLLYSDHYGENSELAISVVGRRKFSFSGSYDFGNVVDRTSQLSLFIDFSTTNTYGYIDENLQIFKIGALGEYHKTHYMLSFAKYNEQIYPEYSFELKMSKQVMVGIKRFAIYGPGNLEDREINRFSIGIDRGPLNLSLVPVIISEGFSPKFLYAGLKFSYFTDITKFSVKAYKYNFIKTLNQDSALDSYFLISLMFSPNFNGIRFRPFIDTKYRLINFNDLYNNEYDYTETYIREIYDIDDSRKLRATGFFSIGVRTRLFSLSYNIKDSADPKAEFNSDYLFRYMKVEWYFKK